MRLPQMPHFRVVLLAILEWGIPPRPERDTPASTLLSEKSTALERCTCGEFLNADRLTGDGCQKRQVSEFRVSKLQVFETWKLCH